MEQESREIEKTRRMIQVQTGRTARSMGVLAYSPEEEAKMPSAPTLTAFRKRLQNPDGSFKYMAGFDRTT